MNLFSYLFLEGEANNTKLANPIATPRRTDPLE